MEIIRRLKNNIQYAALNSGSRIFFSFSSPFSSIFSLKPWKLRGKVVSLHKKSYKKEIMGHQEDIVKTERKIIIIRDTQVILDRDVAELYGVETREINQALRNNPKSFLQVMLLS